MEIQWSYRGCSFITLDYQVILLSFCFPLAIHILIMRYMEGRKILLATSVDSKRLSKTLLSLIVYYIIFFLFFLWCHKGQITENYKI